ncbi:MAG: multicopper oxidase family protein [Microbacterium sp.]|nr:multicopper oxidase family protein [Microbacterium sp.]
MTRSAKGITRRGALALAVAGATAGAVAWLVGEAEGAPGTGVHSGSPHAGHGSDAVAGLEGVRERGQTGLLLRSRIDLPAPFGSPLPLLRPARAVHTAQGDLYEITARSAVAELLPGVQTTIHAYDGRMPGPLIVSRRGTPVIVRVRNELPFPVTTHLHGGRTPAVHDGFPTDLVLPVGGWPHPLAHEGRIAEGGRDYVYPLDQRAATLWYHDHRMDFTGAQVWLGLAGMHLHRDEEEDALSLPRGDREVPLMIADRAFDADGSLMYPAVDRDLAVVGGVTGGFHDGVLGDVILVNGRAWPELEVEPAQYRLRLVNASNARWYRLTLDGLAHDEPGFVQIGGDGGLLAAPVRHRALQLAPGERFDVVVDFRGLRRGDAVVLGNALGDGSTAKVMRFRVRADQADDDVVVPDVLGVVEPLGEPVRARSFSFGRADAAGASASGHAAVWRINGEGYDPTTAVAEVRAGDVEEWEFTTDNRHPVHVHLSPFQVVARGARGPGPFDAGWKDTIALGPGERARVRVRFDADPGRYMLHCHTLEHEDMAMMANFDVV